MGLFFETVKFTFPAYFGFETSEKCLIFVDISTAFASLVRHLVLTPMPVMRPGYINLKRMGCGENCREICRSVLRADVQEW